MKHIRRIPIAAVLGCLTIVGSAFGQAVEVQKQVVKPNGRIRERDYIYNGINENPWYSNQAIREHLNLTEDQFNQLNTTYKTAWTRYNDGVTQLGENLNDVERTQRLGELNNTFNRDWNQATGTVFTQPNDRQRFNQLYWQYQQYGAFNDPTLQQKLNLTDAQRQKFRDYDRDWNRQMAKWNADYANNRESVINSYNQYQRDFQNNVNSVLTPQQREQWQSLVGKPYAFTPDVYFQNVPVTTAKPVLK